MTAVPARWLRVSGRAVSALLRLARRRGLGGLRTALWTVRAWRRVRRQLRRAGMDGVRLPAPPPTADVDRTVVSGVLHRLGASCLERALVRQRWYAARRTPRTLVIGVTAPSSGFRAHAWLDGEPDRHRHGLVEVLHRPPPPEWLPADDGELSEGAEPERLPAGDRELSGGTEPGRLPADGRELSEGTEPEWLPAGGAETSAAAEKAETGRGGHVG
ncbi:hypothetical protein C6361_33480 [Plantactinospora sp. BC1]|nr:hypothetical protein C6361_33480 [Plantactinospora sp. BC1]